MGALRFTTSIQERILASNTVKSDDKLPPGHVAPVEYSDDKWSLSDLGKLLELGVTEIIGIIVGVYLISWWIGWTDGWLPF